MHARITTIEMDPNRIDDSVQQVETEDVPGFKKIDGFRGFTMFVDRAGGKAIGISYWDSEEQMKASEDEVKDSRRRAAETGGAKSDPQVDRFEVALDTFTG
jgi:heme-degrading monooxygenase HmoA